MIIELAVVLQFGLVGLFLVEVVLVSVFAHVFDEAVAFRMYI
jgi:hypothetical protein